MSSVGQKKPLIGSVSEVVLVACVLGILLVLFTPVPAVVLDFLLVANFSFALLILLLSLYTDSPMNFSTFPALLLIATLFRLSLNIAATRLILSDGDAGAVINAVGSYVVGGNYIIGLVVFIILIVVQYVVVTSGAQRVAEVAARFTLDSMPGKQMSIDADLNMGIIDETQAQERRKNIEKEASFYGAMDGASKFVKGDAIAGIIIILIDIVGGLTVGLAQQGLSWSEALETYTLLTVGDGIATQIPALIISTATGIIVTRAATDAAFGEEISNQIASYPQSLSMLAITLVAFLLLPGMPVLPVLVVLFLVISAMYLSRRNQGAVGSIEIEPENSTESDLYKEIEVLPIEIHVGADVSVAAAGEGSILLEKIRLFRKQLAYDLGFVIPQVSVIENTLDEPSSYDIRLYGSKVAQGNVYLDRLLAISSRELEGLSGVRTKDPTYGLPALWIDKVDRDKATDLECTIVDAVTVMATHITETLKNSVHELLTHEETERLANRRSDEKRSIYDELVPAIMTNSDIQKILQDLLSEKVSIRNMNQILEVLIDYGRQGKSTDELVALVRQKLARSICEPLLTDNLVLNVLTFDPLLEQSLQQGLRVGESGSVLQIDPIATEAVLKSIGTQMESMMSEALKPALLCSPSLRRHIRKITDRVYPYLTVLSLTEIPKSITIKSHSIVSAPSATRWNSAKEEELV